jgi:hypothetical protein
LTEGLGRWHLASGQTIIYGWDQISRLVTLAVAVRDLDEATDLYSVLFESGPHRTDEVPTLGAARARFEVSGFGVDLLAPTGDGPVGEALERDGEGPFEARIQVEDLAAARAFVPGAEEEDGALRVPADHALGARILLLEGSPT